MTEPIRVFVGAVHSHRLMFEVLRWSIKRHASRPVEVRSIGELTAPGLPEPKKPENRPVTPFSFQRFAVPMLAGWRGPRLRLPETTPLDRLAEEISAARVAME